MRMPSDDSAPRVPLGPVGGYVIQNLENLRTERRLTYRQLADRLEQLGRPIPTLGLSRIEKGNRRVDVDDLVALAVALEVSPGTLLLPPDPGIPDEDDEVELTANLRLSGYAARQWMAGHSALPDHEVISWPRPGFHWRVREAEIAELRRRVDLLESVASLPPLSRGESQPVIAAIVTSDRGVLVSRRQDGTPPWGFITGWSEPGESPADTIIREVKEEADLRVKVGKRLGERDHPDTGRRMIYFAARPVHGTEIHVGDEGEIAEVRWVSLAEADELMPGMFAPVREHLAGEIGER
jgi:8-oxo-dGTP pyrophosphatase MutT (NUDIX family)/transcriptional regulator with XRE-family HTH domain